MSTPQNTHKPDLGLNRLIAVNVGLFRLCGGDLWIMGLMHPGSKRDGLRIGLLWIAALCMY